MSTHLLITESFYNFKKKIEFIPNKVVKPLKQKGLMGLEEIESGSTARGHFSGTVTRRTLDSEFNFL